MPFRSDTMIDLGARPWWVVTLLRGGLVLLLAVGSACVVDAFVGPEPLAVRIIAGVFGALVLLLCLGLWQTRDARPRWLGIDHEGVRLVSRTGKNLARIAWSDLAGVGLMTNERRRGRQGWNRSVTVWLELYPVGADAVARQPALRNQWRLGAPRRAGQEHRWLVGLGDDLGRAPLPVGELVRRWRPDLWRGHRAGSLLSG